MNSRNFAWLGAFGIAMVFLIAVCAFTHRQWKNDNAALQRANAHLQMTELARELDTLSSQLGEHARDLSKSDLITQLLQDNSAAAQERVELFSIPWHDVDSLVVTAGAQSVRFSAVITGGKLQEQPADPAILRYLDSLALAATSPPLDSANFIGRSWVVARPIAAHGNGAAATGWLVISRTLSPALLEKLSDSVGAPVSIAERPRGSADSSSADQGGVAIHDAAGAAVLTVKISQGPMAGPSFFWTMAALLLLMAVAAAIGATWLRQWRHRRSLDERYKALIDQANDCIVIVDAESLKVLYTNEAFRNRSGYSAEEAGLLSLGDIFADGESPDEHVLARLKDADSRIPINLQQRCKNGSCIDTEVRCNVLEVEGGNVLAYVTCDVSLRKKHELQLLENQNRLDRMAHHDQLTSLPNRHYLTAFLPNAIAEAKATNSMLGVVFLDLDRFKHINDTRGHETGDKLLQEVAKRLRACVRDSDVVIRMGGDEFVVVFRNVKSYDEVTQGAGRIVETLTRPIIIDRHSLQTTGSVGVSLYPRDGTDMVELLKHSDTAMYQAKDRGRNNVQMFSEVMNRKLKQRVAVEASLREALRLKQLDVYYQPFVNLATRKIVGLEALMRWSHPVHGLIPADQFIPVAEETGLIVPMGNFVLHRTLQTMSAWRKAGVPLVPISLNIAPAQLQRGELQSTISALLKTHGIRPELLQLEMTERAVFDSQTPAGESRQDTMARLRDLGIKIAIDDFGTGYSSLSYLKNWRVDALKIDRSFVRDLVTDSSDLAIVSAIIAIAKHLHIQVIAEGIEGYQQAEILRRLGCTIGQGFLFARPMPADQMLELLRESAEPAQPEEDMLAAFSAGGS
jgi:diguanylate cyclase (GGDEF)-like protein/PAS domain S-box-containing protein